MNVVWTLFALFTPLTAEAAEPAGDACYARSVQGHWECAGDTPHQDLLAAITPPELPTRARARCGRKSAARGNKAHWSGVVGMAMLVADDMGVRQPSFVPVDTVHDLHVALLEQPVEFLYTVPSTCSALPPQQRCERPLCIRGDVAHAPGWVRLVKAELTPPEDGELARWILDIASLPDAMEARPTTPTAPP